MVAVRIDTLVKHYGLIKALKGVSVEVEEGEIFGLLGPNGAGKTTMVKILLGIVRPTSGVASIFDQPTGDTRIKREVGYLPEDHRFPEYHTASSLLNYFGALLEVPRARRRKRADEVLELVGLKARKDYKIRTYSKGMKQRLGIAQALFHDPKVIFLDEPTDGVDPVGRREVRDMLLRLKSQRVTIFLNSHLLGEVEQICDRVAILDRGEMVRLGTVDELTQHEGAFEVGLAGGEALPEEEIRQWGYEVTREKKAWLIRPTEADGVDRVMALLVQKGLHLRRLVERRETLEELFVKVVTSEPD